MTHGHGYDLANQAAYLDGTLRWGLDWLIKVRGASINTQCSFSGDFAEKVSRMRELTLSVPSSRRCALCAGWQFGRRQRVLVSEARPRMVI